MAGSVELEMRQQSMEGPGFQLDHARIEVWCLQLEVSSEILQQLGSLLSEDERCRASNFRFERHKSAFILSRGMLRALAARYLGIPGSEVRFEYGPNGKPALLDSRVCFNISHTDRMALFAFTLDGLIGVDIERVRNVEDMLQIARRFFAPSEAESLLALPAELRQRAFFDCWTRKEAYLKATGEGLSRALSDFQVTTTERGEPTLLIPTKSGGNGPGWVLRDLSVSPDFSAALAYQDKNQKVLQSDVLSARSLLQSTLAY